MYPNESNVINSIQRGKLEDDNKHLICTSVQFYYKHLRSVGALRDVVPQKETYANIPRGELFQMMKEKGLKADVKLKNREIIELLQGA